MPIKPPGAVRALTPKQRRFVTEYLKDLNATQVAIRAGYAAKRADAIGWENLRKPEIATAVASGQAHQLEAADRTANATKEAVRRQVCGDVRRLFDEHGNFRPIHTLSGEDAALITGFEIVVKNAAGGDGHAERLLKVRLQDPAPSVQMAMKHLGLLVERHQHDVAMTLEDLVVGSRGSSSEREP
jgi:phage terminase small subunit